MADEVIVLISRPTRGGRKLPNGREITAEDSLKIWNLLTQDLPNVEVGISNHASPLTAAYEYVGRDGPLEEGTKVILGASNKGGDAGRWAGAEKYIKEGVKLMDPFATAVKPSLRPNGVPYSASDMRELLGAAETSEDAIEELEDFIGEDNVFDLLSILGIASPMQEMSGAGAAGGAAVGAKGGPWGNKKEIEDDNEAEKQRSKLVTRENTNLVTVDEVMRLIMERGILR